jgi:hypothetical protein
VKQIKTESGQSMLEVLVAMSLLVVLATMGLLAVSTNMKVSAQGLGKAQGTFADNAVLAELRQEVVSANIVYDPSTEFNPTGGFNGTSGTNCLSSTSSGSGNGWNCAASVTTGNLPQGFSLRLYTQLNGNFTCLQWRLLTSGVLQTRSWIDGWQLVDPSGATESGVVTGWQTLVSGLKNSSSQPPFLLDPAGNYGASAGARLLDVNLLAAGNNTSGATVQISSSISARDAEYFPTQTGYCSPVPGP